MGERLATTHFLSVYFFSVYTRSLLGSFGAFSTTLWRPIGQSPFKILPTWNPDHRLMLSTHHLVRTHPHTCPSPLRMFNSRGTLQLHLFFGHAQKVGRNGQANPRSAELVHLNPKNEKCKNSTVVHAGHTAQATHSRTGGGTRLPLPSLTPPPLDR